LWVKTAIAGSNCFLTLFHSCDWMLWPWNWYLDHRGEVPTRHLGAHVCHVVHPTMSRRYGGAGHRRGADVAARDFPCRRMNGGASGVARNVSYLNCCGSGHCVYWWSRVVGGDFVRTEIVATAKEVKLCVVSELLPSARKWKECIWTVTNTTHCLSAVHWVITPLHVSGVSAAHHQEVVSDICGMWYCWQSPQYLLMMGCWYTRNM
jgi:hypothetical protein